MQRNLSYHVKDGFFNEISLFQNFSKSFIVFIQEKLILQDQTKYLNKQYKKNLTFNTATQTSFIIFVMF